MSFDEDPAKFIASDASVADKIRALDAAGYPRAEIARMLGKRYQHVRNVLEGDKLKSQRSEGLRPSSWWAGVERLPGGGSRIGDLYRLPIDAEGRVTLPQSLMKAFGLRTGGVAVAERDGELFTIISHKESMRRVRADIPQWRPGEPMWSEELIADRRREQAAEDEDNG
jgi:bifunctional DNA-binding transcriptional regulator/antitoxin component of YhaV-PrlF toxin-antitoxin module